MKEKIFLTPAGHEALLKEREELMARLRAAQFKKGQAATNDTNTWHDNAEFDLYKHEEMILTEQIAEVVRKIENSSIVPLPKDNLLLCVGHIAVLRLESGETKKYAVGGFGETNLSATPPKLSYDAPLINSFVGQPLEHIASVRIKGELVEMTLVEII